MAYILVDVNKAILMAVRTGKVSFGGRKTTEEIRANRAKLVILATNCPDNLRRQIISYAKATETPLLNYSQPSVDLGVASGKPFAVLALSILDPGDSEILKLTEPKNV